MSEQAHDHSIVPEARGGSSLARRRRGDRFARGVVTVGGVGIIAVILTILIFIAGEALPLLGEADVTVEAPMAVPSVFDPELLDVEKGGKAFVGLGLDGVVRFEDFSSERKSHLIDAATGARIASPEQATRRFVGVRKTPGERTFSGATADGEIVVYRYRWMTRPGEEGVEIDARTERFRFEGTTGPPSIWTVQAKESETDISIGSTCVAAQWPDGSVRLARIGRTSDEFDGTVRSSEVRDTIAFETPLSQMLLDREEAWLYGIDDEGRRLHTWRIRSGKAGAYTRVPTQGAPITSMSFLKGDISLLLGRRDGRIEVWFRLKEPEVEGAASAMQRPALIRDFELPGESVRMIVPSPRDKTFMALGSEGGIGVYNSTSSRTLWVGTSPMGDRVRALAYAPRGDGLFLSAGGEIQRMALDNPHPSAGFEAFFLPVHYERQDEPALAWQSSSSNDDYEPKLSLIPLIFGTLKGTLFSLLLAVPLAVLGALFTSQFLHPSTKAKVKPIIEIMAALPSVVLGFIGGIWLAPRIEQVIPGMFLLILVLPLTVITAGAVWHRFPPHLIARLPRTAELGFYMLAIVIGFVVALGLSDAMEALMFGGDYRSFFQETMGLDYDQRNAVVIAIAMGFAVIPIIYTISEDAFSNVPRNLSLGSRAMGATQWQTVSKVILPTASPGIFSAVMVGLGRAVGETMVVLMATGNTPILEWNPFNGMRTLSANIATELPEAPYHGTLYRTLFLSAFLLFLITFLVNTIAEVVRERLRKKYGRM